MASIRKRKWRSGGSEKVAWVCDHRDQEGDRVLRTFPTKKEAQAFRDDMGQQVRRGTYTSDSKSGTVGEAADSWLDNCIARGNLDPADEDHLERSSIKQMREHIRKHIKPFIGDMKLSRLTARDVTKFITTLRDNGRS